jgi:hypothetical protein
MALKGEISWKRRTEDGERLEIYAHRVGTRWNFYVRQKRYDQWEPLEQPPLEDWLQLLDSVRRRVARRLLRPEEIGRVEKTIREAFPEAKLEG